MKKRDRFGIFWLLLLASLCLFSSCRTFQKDPLAACKSPFAATVSGTLNGVDFCAEITVSTDAGRILFSSPSPLDGMELTVSGGTVRLVGNGTDFQTDKETLNGLLLPLEVLTGSHGEPERVEKQGDQFAVAFPDGVEVTVSKAGLPRFVSFPGGSFRVIDFSSE